MNCISNHDSALKAYTGIRTSWANEINFGINHAPGAGSIAGPIDRQSSIPKTVL